MTCEEPVTANQNPDPCRETESAGARAPYRRFRTADKDQYNVGFKQGYTLKQHFAFLGKEIESRRVSDRGYGAKLDPELFQAVRRDPGVECIEDETLPEYGPSETELCNAARVEIARDTRKAIALSTSTGYRAPYQRNEDAYENNYIVAFDDGYTLAQHFAFLGREIRIEGELNEGYFAEMDRDLFDAVRRDPGVRFIEDDTLGSREEITEEDDLYAALGEAAAE